MAFPIWFEDKFGPHTIELYADEIRQTQLQLATIRDLIGTPPGGYPLLDLCCGWGRHAAPLYEMGYPVVGLDGSRYFLERVERKHLPGCRERLELVRGDMRSLPFARETFAAVIQMYTSFGYGTDPRDDKLTLREVNRVLRPGGRYLLDLINWTLARKAFNGRYEESYPSFDAVEECRIKPGTNMLRVKRALLYRDGRKPHIYSFEIRMFDQQSLTALLKAADFEITQIWGDFKPSPYKPQRSYRMIMICRKSGA